MKTGVFHGFLDVFGKMAVGQKWPGTSKTLPVKVIKIDPNLWRTLRVGHLFDQPNGYGSKPRYPSEHSILAFKID